MRKLLFVIVLVMPIIISGSVIQAAKFGEESVGGTAQTIENQIWGGIFSPASSGTLDSIAVYYYISGSAHNVKLAVYKLIPGGDSVLIDSTTEIQKAADFEGWDTLALDLGGYVHPDTNYALSAWAISTGGNAQIFSDEEAGNYAFSVDTYGAWPDPWGTLTGGTTVLFSIFAFYTPEGGEPAAGQVIIIQQ